MKTKIMALVFAGALAMSMFAGAASAAGPGGTIGDDVSDVLMGNEPNTISFVSGDEVGPSELEPGDIGDSGDSSGHDYYVEGSGAPGPITCGGNWVGPGLISGVVDASLPGNPAAPGMNVDCGTGGSPPHSP